MALKSKQAFLTLLFGLISRFWISGQDLQILLSKPSNEGVTLSIIFPQNAKFYIEYGTEPSSYIHKTVENTSEAGVPKVINLQSLKSNTLYLFRVQYILGSTKNYQPSKEYRFHTQRSPGSTFVFTVEADEHLYDKKGVEALYKICLENQAQDQPDFMLSLGDTFGDDHNPYDITSNQLKSLYARYRPLLGGMSSLVPFYFVMGNHEGQNNYYLPQNPPNNLAVQASIWKKYYYPNPSPNEFYSGNTDLEGNGIGSPENYYSWTWGDALFVVLDAYRYQSISGSSEKPKGWDWTLGKKQFDWMRKTLEESKAKYKFVFAHHIRGQDRGALRNVPLYEWGGFEADEKTYGFDKNRPGWGKPIHQIFKDTGVNVFFQGHDHLFAMEKVDGIYYQEVPMPSDSTYEIGVLANADAYTANQLKGAGHIRVKVTPEDVTIDFVQAYLPADVKSGKGINRSVAFSYGVNTGIKPLPKPNLVLATGGELDIKIYPNPAIHMINIEIPPQQILKEVRLVNLLGQCLKSINHSQLSIKDVSPGSYLVLVQTNLGWSQSKLLIQAQ